MSESLRVVPGNARHAISAVRLDGDNLRRLPMFLTNTLVCMHHTLFQIVSSLDLNMPLGLQLALLRSQEGPALSNIAMNSVEVP